MRASAYAASFKRCLRRPESGDEREQLRDLLNEQLRAAYDMRREDSLHALHASLNEILFRRFNRTRDHVERSPLMFEVQQRIIEAQLDADLQSFKEESLPQSADAFEHWYDARSRLDGRTPHRLFDFIQTQANEAQFRRFIEVEAGVHVSFDDVLALAQVGVRGAPKSEFFHNLQDEVGSTNPDKFHLTMFERLVEGLGIRSISRDALPWEALACGSYMMFLAHFRDFYLYCVGYLGCLEAITPARFGSIARGGARLGVDESLLDYYAEHSVLDTQHAQGWLHNIILPAIYENGAQTSRDIATGVRLRECVAERYWDAMLAELTAPRRSTRKGT
ncbi:putative uncharacterized protein [Caballeronia insecticola]|uniref:Iron-containing redox enzyme family protein n=1 Tax=Caballeronia insecticola TaxID=758793 RepID=R4WFL5_9BURK|nr:putative uncharacterized protein [Caballeronia insecticola]